MSSTLYSARPLLAGVRASSRLPHVQAFLVPSLVKLPQLSHTSSSFSTTPASQSRKTRDNNRLRGVSTVRGTGPRHALSVSNDELPQPVLDAAKRTKVAVDDDHPLWQFFHSKTKPMNTPEEDSEHGRSWTVEELRHKSWEDLHALWWVCCQERNRIATESFERDRLGAGYGEYEASARDRAVRVTMRGIKHALTERYYAWDDARKLARDDPELQFVEDGAIYTPDNIETLENYEAATPTETVQPKTA